MGGRRHDFVVLPAIAGDHGEGVTRYEPSRRECIAEAIYACVELDPARFTEFVDQRRCIPVLLDQGDQQLAHLVCSSSLRFV